MKSSAFLTTMALGALAALATDITPNDQRLIGMDDSASIQNAVDAAAKNGSGQVVIPAWNVRTGRAGWTITRAILLPSNMTIVIDNAHLTMADGVYENFFRGANVWTDKGRTVSGKLSQIRILGRGQAVLDGGTANDLNEQTSQKDGRPDVRANCPVLLVNTEHFEVSGLTVENHRYWGLCFVFCRFGKVSDIRFVARYDRRNQDGVNLRDGCHDITIENISGQTGDDMIALSAIDRPSGDRWSYYVDGLSPDICNVFIRNVSGAAVCHPLIALRNHNGACIHDITVENVRDGEFVVPCKGSDKERYALVRIGNQNYWQVRKARLGETSRITLRGLTANHSAVGVVVNNTLQDTLISDVRIGGAGTAAVATSGPEWGDMGATMENVTIENAHIDSSGAHPTILDDRILNPGDSIRNVRLRNCSVMNASGRETITDKIVSRNGPATVPVAKAENVVMVEGELTLDHATSGELEVAPFRPGCNPQVVLRATRRGASEVVLEVATATDAGGRPGEWSPWRQVKSGRELTLSDGMWLKYRVRLKADGGLAPSIREIRFGTARHTGWDIPRYHLDGGHRGN